MNEYQDQATWWVTEYYQDGMWHLYQDHDTYEQAQEAAAEYRSEYRSEYPHCEWRVRRESGLNAWES